MQFSCIKIYNAYIDLQNKMKYMVRFQWKSIKLLFAEQLKNTCNLLFREKPILCGKKPNVNKTVVSLASLLPAGALTSG